jgi:purine-nucleoside phosphorylase
MDSSNLDKNQFDLAEEAKNYINNRSEHFKPRFGLVLGTGLGKLAEEILVHAEIPYQDIPNFPVSTVEGHAGKLILGFLEGIPVVAMSGRFHYYEGYSAKQVTFPIRVMKMLGIERLFISSAVGSVNADMNAGDIVLIKDHINLQPENPLRGFNDSRFGVRFPDMKDAYDQAMNTEVINIGKELSIDVKSGVYLALQGPNLETPAEYRFAHIIGADVIGMSTVPEVIVARHMELPVLVSTVVSNKCYPIEEIQETTLEDVLRVVNEAEPKLAKLIKTVLKRIS